MNRIISPRMESVRFYGGLLAIAACIAFFPWSSHGASSADTGSVISWSLIVIGLAGGLALFLYGMEKMSQGLKKSAGNKIRAILGALTKNRLLALGIGAFVTMVIQSSSATTVMLVSFVQAELISFGRSMAVILGANIGTTVTAQMVAFKLTDYALLIIALGFGARFFSQRKQVKAAGDIVLGFGILFFGMKIMSDAMSPLRDYPAFLQALEGLENPLFGVAAGALFTALVQSSSASTGVVIVLAQQGLLSLSGGIAVILGANIGTCVTAGLASIGTGREAKRVALAHVVFNIGGVLLFVFWIPEFADLMKDLSGSLNLGVARQIANAHTCFNICAALLFLPFTGVLVRLINLLLPDVSQPQSMLPQVWYLDKAMITTPPLALELAQAEIARMVKLLNRMHQALIRPIFSEEEQPDKIFPQLTRLEGVQMREKKLLFLEHEVRNYLLQVSGQELDERQANEATGMIAVLDNMHQMNEVLMRSIYPIIEEKKGVASDFSGEGKVELIEYHTKIGKQLSRLEELVTTKRLSMAQKLEIRKERYVGLDNRYRRRHLARLLEERPEALETHRFHMELMDGMRQLNIYVAEMARILLSYGFVVGEKGESQKEPDDLKSKEEEK
ncbi:MAG: Na/Pi cotransporter family protein [Thermodesulfobacteriota bacterium]